MKKEKVFKPRNLNVLAMLKRKSGAHGKTIKENRVNDKVKSKREMLSESIENEYENGKASKSMYGLLV